MVRKFNVYRFEILQQDLHCQLDRIGAGVYSALVSYSSIANTYVDIAVLSSCMLSTLPGTELQAQHIQLSL